LLYIGLYSDIISKPPPIPALFPGVIYYFYAAAFTLSLVVLEDYTLLSFFLNLFITIVALAYEMVFAVAPGRYVHDRMKVYWRFR
jgi:hypothetical protein